MDHFVATHQRGHLPFGTTKSSRLPLQANGSQRYLFRSFSMAPVRQGYRVAKSFVDRVEDFHQTCDDRLLVGQTFDVGREGGLIGLMYADHIH